MTYGFVYAVVGLMAAAFCILVAFANEDLGL